MKLSKTRFHLCYHIQSKKGKVCMSELNGMKSSIQFFFIYSLYYFGTRCHLNLPLTFHSLLEIIFIFFCSWHFLPWTHNRRHKQLIAWERNWNLVLLPTDLAEEIEYKILPILYHRVEGWKSIQRKIKDLRRLPQSQLTWFF